MVTKLKIGSFNCENLFARPKLLNLDDHTIGTDKLKLFAELNSELKKTTYNKNKILNLYSQLSKYINVISTRGKLFNRDKTQINPDGKLDWEGWLSLKRDKIPDEARSNTARVIQALRADILCLIEVEDRPLLKHFNAEKLNYRYPHLMLIDGNDSRGIDVALLSKHEIGALWSHIDDRDPDTGRKLFSRDCLEAQIKHEDGFDIYILTNHFKSKGYGSVATSNSKRKAQANRVAEIVSQQYDLQTDFVVVAGDLNDTPNSATLRELISTPDLHDVLELQFANPDDRWTYHYSRNEQIDYLLVSTALKNHFHRAGVERRGIYGVERYTNGAITSFPEVNRYRNSASDHGAVWAEFRIS